MALREVWWCGRLSGPEGRLVFQEPGAWNLSRALGRLGKRGLLGAALGLPKAAPSSVLLPVTSCPAPALPGLSSVL